MNLLKYYRIKTKAVKEQAMSIATVTSASDEIKEMGFNKSCGKSFGDFTNSVMSGTRSTHNKWFVHV